MSAPPLEPREELATDRLVLRLARPSEAALVVDYFARNRAHLAAWEPVPPPAFFTEAFWADRLETFARDRDEGRAYRFHLFERGGAARIVGTVGIANVVRSAFHSAHLGFGLDGEREGRGLMSEACARVIAFAWEDVRLHRLEANHQPHNLRSAKLLRRLGFVPYGYSRDYLFIAGKWTDHVNTALLNETWEPPAS